MLFSPRSIRNCCPGALAFLAVVAVTPHAAAQIEEPGNHLAYKLELEPHLVIGYDRTWNARGTGVGPGIRASIPILPNGPLPKINNSLAVGVGFDWTFFSGCAGQPDSADCNVNQIWVPVVAQWNFFFTPVVSAFGEVGLAIEHGHLSYSKNCPFLTSDLCTSNDLSLLEPVLFIGGRFSFSKKVGLLVRLGTPYVSIGADFLL